MELQKLVYTSIKNIFFAIIVITMALPILLSMPGFSRFFFAALSYAGLAEE